MQRCFRCGGRKKIYKSGNAYSWVDSGGVLSDCPMCLGVGKIKTAEEFFSEQENAKNEIPDEINLPNKKINEQHEINLPNTKINEQQKEKDLKKQKTKKLK